VPDGLPAVRADRTQLRHALEHVIRNADQAMAGSGVVEISAELVDITPDGGLPLPAGPFVVITIADHGPGITDEVKARMFDPYFTTRPGANGLGLPTAHSILRRHGGLITVDFRPGGGAVFRLYVPADRQPAAQAAGMRPSARAGKRVLLVDDEDAVRNVAVRMLQHIGYDAVAVAHGHQALQAYDAAHHAGTPFDLVILDLTLAGGIGGVDALKLIRERFPEVTAVVSSGYSSDPVLASFADYGFKGVIVKPYTLTKLADTLTRVLATARAASE